MNASKNQSWGIHWFRRDLRIPDNLALKKNHGLNQSRVLGIFCFDSVFLSRSDFSHNRFAFFLNSLKKLKSEMQALGGDLWVVDARPLDAFKMIFSKLQNNMPSTISFNRDYEPFAKDRDQQLSDYFKSLGINLITERDHVLFEPWEVTKDDGFYQVYSPYAKKWFQQLQNPNIQTRIQNCGSGKKYLENLNSASPKQIFYFKWAEVLNSDSIKDSLDAFITENSKNVSIPIPESGFSVAYNRLEQFKNRISNYKNHRDFPNVDGTSGLSVFFKNGSLSAVQAMSLLQLNKLNFQDGTGQSVFLKELVWREFYYSILHHRPDAEKQCFLPQFRNIQWENNQTYFKKWCEGLTGFPIVDAGMRQLNQTGWMHNRVRMIVASFLTKDLLIDWKLGENYFMKQLLDGDLAANNGGWQWAASTGCDPQPYFRIFNPWLQSEKFDPTGEYIKKYIPELSKIPPEDLHDPESDRSLGGYPKPIVNHSVQRDKALSLYKTV